MKALRVLGSLVRADFLERVRRYSFLITLGVTLLVTYSFIPTADATYETISLGGYRGIYNSAWVGNSMAILTTVFLFLAGFYLVNDAVQRDARTGVGQIIATTPLRKAFYTLGKALSNLAVLAVILATVMVVAGVTQLVRGEDVHLDLAALVLPFLVITLPALALAAALAVLFETVPFLRGGKGNAAYFFLWLMLGLLGAVATEQPGGFTLPPVSDPLGFSIPATRMIETAKTLPGYDDTFNIGPYPREGGLFPGPGGPLRTFAWEGVAWTWSIVLGRLAWVGVALLITVLAALFFDRFDPSKEAPTRKPVGPPPPEEQPAPAAPGPTVLTLSPLPDGLRAGRFPQLVLAELLLLLRGQKRWWYAIALGLLLAGLAAPLNISRIVLLAAWIWPLTLWSGMGSSEVLHHTTQLVFSTPHLLRRQTTALWLAGVIVTALAGLGPGLRLLWSGDTAGRLWVLAVLFIPSFAMALGTWSGSGKPFEILYTILWYVGPVNGTAALDFTGASAGAIEAGGIALYAGILILLFGLALLGRRRQLASM
jgi:hypothetical protein